MQSENEFVIDPAPQYLSITQDILSSQRSPSRKATSFHMSCTVSQSHMALQMEFNIDMERLVLI